VVVAMKVLVGVKRVVDYNVKVRVKADGSGVDVANVKMSMNPFDEIACEEAVRLKEKGHAAEVVAVSMGEAKCQETLRTALAMGADRAILVEVGGPSQLQPLAVAKLFKALVEREQPGLVLLGKQAIDDDSNQVGQMLAALLGWAQATFIGKLDIADGEATVAREVDEGIERLKVRLPAVVTSTCAERAALRQPAQHHEGEEEADRDREAADLGVDIGPAAPVPALRGAAQAAGRGEGRLGPELVQKLKAEAGVI
jgi:electron transfer flavoprotein alpha/beta subunit